MAIEYRRRSSPANADRRSGSIRRRLRLVSVVFLAAFQIGAFVGSAQAAKFDEKIKAPEAPRSNAELRSVIRDYFDTYSRANSQSIGGVVRDKAAHKAWQDTWWRLGAAMETWKSPVELAEYGITPKGDGTYAIDIVHFPQWDPLDKRLSELLNPGLFTFFVAELRPLGFRESDVEAMKTYIAANRPERRAIEENMLLIESFGAIVNAADLARKQISRAQVQAFRYQRQRISAEAYREWAVGLLDCLDKQRQRILVTYFMERPGGMAMAPDPPDALDRELADFRSGEYVRALETERERMLMEKMEEAQP